MSAIDFGAEKRLAAWRLFTLAVLLAGVGSYRGKIEIKRPNRMMPGSLGASSASVSWLKDGAPLSAQDLAKLNPAAALARAKEISEQVNARAVDAGVPAEDRRPGDDDPAVVVPMMVGYLAAPSAGQRAYAAMTLCDNRFAKWEGAGAAVPGLEAVVAGKDPEGAEFAELALKRIRFWADKRRGAAKP